MELRHLRYFVAVAEELSFRGAAARLQVAQPPLSRQIRDLELEIGVKLLERNQRNVLLTKAGKSFLQDVKILLHQVDTAVATAQRIHQNQAGLLSIAYNRAASYQILPRLLSILATSELQIQTIEMDNDRLLAALQQQQIDVAIGYAPIEQPKESLGSLSKASIPNPDDHRSLSIAALLLGTNWAAIQSETILLAKPALLENSPEQASAPPESKLELESLTGQTLILPPYLWDRKDGERQVFIELLKSRRIVPNNIREVADRETALSFVANDLGVTIIPSSMGYMERQEIIYQELSGNWEKLEIMAIWKSGNRSASLGSLITAINSLLISH
jgi:DNA-binding transcriptional LysR family regulator